MLGARRDIRIGVLKLLLCVMIFAGLLTKVSANETNRADLTARIIAAGTHETENRRTGIRIDDCRINTFVHTLNREHGWILYSNFVFDLESVEVRDMGNNSYHIYTGGWGAVFFRPLTPYTVPHEVPTFRYENRESEPSKPRGELDYKIVQSKRFFVWMDGLTSEDKPRALSTGLNEYRRRYCLPVG